MLICVNVVQVCDATTADSSNAAGYKIKTLPKQSLLIIYQLYNYPLFFCHHRHCLDHFFGNWFIMEDSGFPGAHFFQPVDQLIIKIIPIFNPFNTLKLTGTPSLSTINSTCTYAFLIPLADKAAMSFPNCIQVFHKCIATTRILRPLMDGICKYSNVLYGARCPASLQVSHQQASLTFWVVHH